MKKTGKMLHDEARELLVESYEKNAYRRGTLQDIWREQVYRLPHDRAQAEGWKCGASHVAAGQRFLEYLCRGWDCL